MASKELITNTHQFVEESRAEWAMSLNSDLDIDSFIAAVTTALVMNPDVVAKCTAQSIKNSCIKAAYAGLRPDGKEGALVPYWNKDIKAMEAQFMAMVYGIRKKARQNDDILITSEVVYKNDEFVVEKGDDEKLIHKPAPMDQDPGEIIAAYAIFRKGDTVLHREVLRKTDLDSVRGAASDNSPAWKNWRGEMSRKAAVNRGAKSVPMSDRTRAIIDYDNQFYDLGANAKVVSTGRVDLGSRFGGNKSEGFSGSHGRALENNRQMPMDVIDNETGEVIDAKKQQQQQQDNRQQQSRQQSGGQQQGKAADSAQSKVSIEPEVFSSYSGALMRVSTAENLEKAHGAFWRDKETPTEGTADHALLRVIYSSHTKRIKGESTPEDTKKAVDTIIAGQTGKL